MPYRPPLSKVGLQGLEFRVGRVFVVVAELGAFRRLEVVCKVPSCLRQLLLLLLSISFHATQKKKRHTFI